MPIQAFASFSQWPTVCRSDGKCAIHLQHYNPFNWRSFLINSLFPSLFCWITLEIQHYKNCWDNRVVYSCTLNVTKKHLFSTIGCFLNNYNFNWYFEAICSFWIIKSRKPEGGILIFFKAIFQNWWQLCMKPDNFANDFACIFHFYLDKKGKCKI